MRRKHPREDISINQVHSVLRTVVNAMELKLKRVRCLSPTAQELPLALSGLTERMKNAGIKKENWVEIIEETSSLCGDMVMLPLTGNFSRNLLDDSLSERREIHDWKIKGRRCGQLLQKLTEAASASSSAKLPPPPS